MPFKTKKQKEAAENRRVLFAQNALVTYSRKPVQTTDKVKRELATGETASSIAKDYLFVRRDLFKIAGLSSAIILAQIIFFLFKSS